MARSARLVIPGLPHHVVQRAARGKRLFFDDKDRRRYLDLLARYAARRRLETIRASTRTGRAAGDEAFLARIEKLTSRPLRPRKADRPRKARGKPKK